MLLVPREEFRHALDQWHDAASEAVHAEVAHETAYARALLDATGTNEAQRKAAATLATAETDARAKLAKVEAERHRQWLLFLRASALPDRDAAES